jgi:hypothetical protein
MDYKVGDKIKIIEMVDETAYTGRTGIIEHIDARGQLHGTWGGLAVIPEEDSIEIIGGYNSPTFQPKDEVERELFEAMGPRKYTDEAYLGMTPEQRKRERARRRREASRGAKAEAAKPVEKPVEAQVEKPAAKEQPAVSKPVEEKTVYSELKKLESLSGTSVELSGWKRIYIRKITVDEEDFKIHFEKGSMNEAFAEEWVNDFLGVKGFNVKGSVYSYYDSDPGSNYVHCVAYVGLSDLSLKDGNSTGELKEYGIYVDSGYGLDLEMVVKAHSESEAYSKARNAGYGKYVRVELL